MPTRRAISPFHASALAVAIAATAGTATPAAAQDSQRAAGLEEVIVTAQRREQSLQIHPDRDHRIHHRQAQRSRRIRRLAGRRFRTQRHDPEAALLELEHEHLHPRHVGQGETSLLADPKVGIYIDGVFMSKSVGAVFDVADLERIEVLRGPQGTLFGRNTTGGAVNVTTKKPTGELRGKATASIGNFGYLRYGGSLDLPAVSQSGSQDLVQPHAKPTAGQTTTTRVWHNSRKCRRPASRRILPRRTTTATASRCAGRHRET
jgi:iron complex outermembrane receptor protein